MRRRVLGKNGYYYSMACTPLDHGLLAPSYSEAYTGTPASGDPDSLYDPNHTLDVRGCNG